MKPGRLTTVLLVLLLAGCGFHLRGMEEGGDLQIGALFIDMAPGNEVGQELEVRLRSLGTELATVRSDAEYTLALSPERTSRRGTATTAAAGVAEYEVRLEIDLRLIATDGTAVRACYE